MVDRFLSCDWGTSQLRLRLADGETGEALGEVRSDDGVSRLASAPGDRAEAFRLALARCVGELAGQAGADLGGLPIVISGMASSSIGWRELPYARLPFALDGRDAVWSDVGPLAGGQRAVLLSGVRSETDVMRGEETEALGAARLPAVRSRLGEAVLVLPGTHSKHVQVASGRMVAFQTFMTGELFSVLAAHSILRHSTQAGGPWDEEAEAFREGVREAASRPLTAALFRVRTRQLLEGCGGASNAAFLSGALIGAEAAALRKGSAPIVLCAGPRLSGPYATAMEALGMADRLTVVPPADAECLSALGQALVLRRILAGDISAE